MEARDLELVLSTFHATKSAGEATAYTLGDDATISLHVSASGVGLTIGKIVALRLEGGLAFATNAKRETYAVRIADVFAVAADASVVAGETPRRAGFGR
jgi:hypothetical protein